MFVEKEKTKNPLFEVMSQEISKVRNNSEVIMLSDLNSRTGGKTGNYEVGTFHLNDLCFFKVMI